MSGNEQGLGFESLARELGCDPDDPRVAEVLKSMAAQPPKPHEKPSGNKAPASRKKRPAAKGS
jgi:hypothetical protein